MKTITVLCGEEMLGLLKPIESSRTWRDSHGCTYAVAVYDEDELDTLQEETVWAASAWWRFTQGLTIHIPVEWDALRERGLRLYLCDYEVSTERHLAGAIMDLAREAGMTPIQFMDWCVDNAPEPAAAARG